MNALGEERLLQRGEMLLNIGQRERWVYLVTSGAFRVFCHTDPTSEQTVRFAYAGNLVTSVQSLFEDRPSEYGIMALRQSVVLQLDYLSFKRFVNQSGEQLMAYSQFLEQLVVQQMQRELDLLTASPIERYRRVIARSPQLFQEVPLKYIADYLRMTPETLSRLRADLNS
ncbi:MAG TPA: Crp/Fnr family transcriptional regulator [Luteibaculaceae bacterium]|nr:Crp/Fnr family transcriptional regulator [Luteibaculaceae bacterium]